MADDRVQVEIGFDGTQIMIARVTAASADELERGLQSGAEGAVTLEADDGRYTVSLRKIVYIKRFSRESRVGFGAG